MAAMLAGLDKVQIFCLSFCTSLEITESRGGFWAEVPFSDLSLLFHCPPPPTYQILPKVPPASDLFYLT